jgi:hypothetical protein
LKTTVDLADLGGLYLVLMGIPGKSHAKVLTAGVGWAGADILLSRFLLLWVGARGAEFDWIYIQKSFDSNISLVSMRSQHEVVTDVKMDCGLLDCDAVSSCRQLPTMQRNLLPPSLLLP